MAQLMMTQAILPVMDGGKMIGIVRCVEIVNAIAMGGAPRDSYTDLCSGTDFLMRRCVGSHRTRVFR